MDCFDQYTVAGMRGQFWASSSRGLCLSNLSFGNLALAVQKTPSWPAGWRETIGPVAFPAPTDSRKLQEAELSSDRQLDQKNHQLNPDKIIDLQNSDLKNGFPFDVFYYARRDNWYWWCLRFNEKQWIIFLLCLCVYFPPPTYFLALWFAYFGHFI